MGAVQIDVKNQKTAKRKKPKAGFYPLIPPRASQPLTRNCPQGRGMDAARFSQGLGCPFEKPSPKARSAGLRRYAGRPFLWFLSFGRAKERNSAVGPRPDF